MSLNGDPFNLDWASDNKGRRDGRCQICAARGGPCRSSRNLLRLLARQLVARQGFGPAPPQKPVRSPSKATTRSSAPTANSPVVVALIDREAHPGKAFTLPPGAYTRSRKTVGLRPGASAIAKMPGQRSIRSKSVRRPTSRRGSETSSPRLLDSNVAAWAIDPQRATIWTTAGWRGRSLRNFIEKLLEIAARDRCRRRPGRELPRSFPGLTAAIIVVLAAIFAPNRVRRRRNRPARSS